MQKNVNFDVFKEKSHDKYCTCEQMCLNTDFIFL